MHTEPSAEEVSPHHQRAVSSAVVGTGDQGSGTLVQAERVRHVVPGTEPKRDRKIEDGDRGIIIEF